MVFWMFLVRKVYVLDDQLKDLICSNESSDLKYFSTDCNYYRIHVYLPSYLPTFTIQIHQMRVNIAYMNPMGNEPSMSEILPLLRISISSLCHPNDHRGKQKGGISTMWDFGPHLEDQVLSQLKGWMIHVSVICFRRVINKRTIMSHQVGPGKK